MSRPLRVLVQRAQTIGVADHTNIGLCVSALHQLKLLKVESTSLLEAIHGAIHQASTRSKVNVFECLVRNINVDKHIAFCDNSSSNSSHSITTVGRVNDKQHQLVSDNLPDLFHRILREIQLDLMQNDAIDELGVTDTVVFTETLLQLMAWRCTGDVNNNLLRTLQDRLLAFVNVAKSPLEWMSIVRIAIEVYRLPVQALHSTTNKTKSKNMNDINSTMKTPPVAASSMSLSLEKVNHWVSVDEETHRWSDSLLTRVLTNITTHLPTFTKRELMQLFDTITLRRSNTFKFSSLMSISPSTRTNNENENNNINEHVNIDGNNNNSNNGITVLKPESNTTNVAYKCKQISSDDILSRNDNVYENIPDNCRVLIKSILDLIITEHMEHLTAAQSTAWLHRLVSCKLNGTHDLFARITEKMISRELYKNMSREQLSSAVCSLGRALLNENTVTFDKARQRKLVHGFSSTNNNNNTKSNVKISGDNTNSRNISTNTEIDNRLTLYTLLLKQLVVNLQELPRDNSEAKNNIMHSLLPVFFTLPERAWNAYAQRKFQETQNCTIVPSSTRKADVVQSVTHNNSQTSETNNKINDSRVIDESHFGECDNSSDRESVEEMEKIVYTFADSLQQACSLMLHYFPHLLPRDQMLIVVVTIRWHVFDVHNQCYHSNSNNSNNINYWYNNHNAHVQALMARAQSLTKNEATRKMNALCGLVHSGLTHYNVFQLISLLYEFANAMANAWMHDPRFVSSQLTILRQYKPDEYLSWPLFDQSFATETNTDGIKNTMTSNNTNNTINECINDHNNNINNKNNYYLLQSAEKTTFRLCHVIHRLIQANFVDKLESISTWHLLRYMSAMSKIHVRTRNEYHVILHIVTAKERLSTLLPEELVMLMHCMSLQHVSNTRVIHRLLYVIEHYSHAMSTLHKIQFIISWAALCQTPPCTAPAWAPLESGRYFEFQTEITALPLSVQLDVFYALMELQQYENKTLHWIATSVFGEQVVRTNGANTNNGQAVDTMALLNKLSTIPFLTLMRTATALCRWGNDFVDDAIFSLVLHALTLQISKMQNIFESLTSWGVYWHLFTEYEHLYDSSLEGTCMESNTISNSCNHNKKSHVDDAVRIFTDAARVFIMVRITSIVQDVSLQPNTFLFRQLALAIQLNAMPAEGSDDERQLISNLDLARLPQIRGNLPQTVLACVVVCHVCLRYPETSLTILSFIRECLMLMRVQEKLAIWYYCHITLKKINNYLDGADHEPNTDSLEMISSNTIKTNYKSAMMSTNNNSTTNAQLQKMQELLLAIEIDVKECLVKPDNIARLSPTEKRLKDKLFTG